MIRQSLVDVLILAKLVALAGTVLPPRVVANDRPVAVSRLSPGASKGSGGRPVAIRSVERQGRVALRYAGGRAGRDGPTPIAA